MALSANGARGEVALRVGTTDLVIAAEIGRLAAVSTAIDCKSFGDLYQRLLNVEVAATLAAVRHLVVKGDAVKAAMELTLGDFPACARAFSEALSHHLKVDEGKAVAAGKKARRPSRKSPSPS